MPEEDPRFGQAVALFNTQEWYAAHDVFEEIWHETAEPDRRSLQGILQVAVAQLHLQRGNRRGATILYGEALGRLRRPGTPDFGLDLRPFAALSNNVCISFNMMQTPSHALSLNCNLCHEGGAGPGIRRPSPSWLRPC